MISKFTRLIFLSGIGYGCQILAGVGIVYVAGIISANLPFDILNIDDFINMINVAAGDAFSLLRLLIAGAIALVSIKAYPTLMKGALMTLVMNGLAIWLTLLITALVA